MPQIKLDTGFNIEVDFPIPPFAKRLFAWMIDGVVIAAYLIVGSWLLNKALGPGWGLHIWIVFLFILPYLFYHLLCEIFLNGQSIGKRAMHIKVISADGGQPSISQYMIRWLFRMIDFPAWIFAVISEGGLPWWFA